MRACTNSGVQHSARRERGRARSKAQFASSMPVSREQLKWKTVHLPWGVGEALLPFSDL